MLKILMVAPFETNGRYEGGISAVVNGFMEHMKAHTPADVRITPFNTCLLKRESTGSGKLNISNLRNSILTEKALHKELKTTPEDVLYLHTSRGYALLKDLCIIRQIKKKHNIKTIVHIHYAEYAKIMTKNELLNSIIIKLLSNYADGIVFLSKNTRKEFAAKGIDESKSCVLYNFSTLNYSVEEIANKHCGKKYLFVGSIDSRKGLFDLLEVLNTQSDEYCLTVCGGFHDDKTKQRFEFFQRQMGDKLKFLGYVSGEIKRETFLNNDILFLPSYGEGLPVVILEALSAGCLVATTNVGAIPEIIGENQGYVVSPGDKNAIKQAVKEFNEMPLDTLKQKQSNNHEYAKQFALEQFTKDLVNVCKKCLES